MDTKLKTNLLITLFSIMWIVNVAKSQQYEFQSLKGKAVKLYFSPDSNQNTLSISYLKDSLHIRDIDDVEAVDVLNNKFLKVVYRVRAGTGMKAIRTLLLSVNDDRIMQSLNITSLFSEDFLDFNGVISSPMKVEVKSRYLVELSLKGETKFDYKIVASIHDERTASHDPKTNYKNDFLVTLKFDKEKNIFYNSLEHLSGNFTVWEPKIKKRVKRYINGDFPVVKLGNNKYYYIKLIWHRVSDERTLTKYTY